MIGAFVLLPWDLDELDLGTTNLTLHLIEVSFHSFTIAFVAAIDLTSYDLGVAVYDHVFSPCCLARSSPAIKASYFASLLVV